MQASWPSEYLLLGLLCERPRHGYELAQAVQADEALHAIWRFERSEVYFLLGKLAQQGHITPLAVEQGTGPARTIYGPSATGHAALLAWLRTPERYPRNLRSSLLARIYLALRLETRLAVELIDLQMQDLAAWLEHQHGQTVGNELVALVRRLRAAQVEATLGALEDLRRLALARTKEWADEGHAVQD